MREQWRDIEGYQGRYQVSSFGRVKTMPRCWLTPTNEICIKEKVLTLQPHYRGYLFVHLYDEVERKKFFVHRLVAFAFLENPEGKEVVNHKDRDKTNNKLSNLEWLTFAENTAHWMGLEAEVEMAASDIPF